MSADKCPVCGDKNSMKCGRSYPFGIPFACSNAERLAIERAKEIETLTKNLADAQGDNAQEAMENKQLAEQVETLKAALLEEAASNVDLQEACESAFEVGKQFQAEQVENLKADMERLKSTRLEIPPPPEGFEAVLHLAQIQGQCSQADFELTCEGWKKPSFGISSAQIIARKKEQTK